MASRDAFLSRVRHASGLGKQYRVHLQPVPDGTGYLGAGGDLCQHFAAEVNAVGGQAFLMSDMSAATEQLRQLLAECGAQSAVCWRHEVLDRIGLVEQLAAAGIEMLDYRQLSGVPAERQRELLLACEIGITSCDVAIAETGTLMMCSRPGQERVASLLPRTHIAVVERKQIVPDLIDAFRMLRGDDQRMTNDGLPSNTTFITGPSKTGDIELQLTTGVHGPAIWQVIIIG